MFRSHCTALAAALWFAAPGAASAQQAPQPTPGDAAFGVFVRNTQIGHEQVTLAHTESGWIITSSGNLTGALEFTLTRFEIKYSPDWTPQEMRLDAKVRQTQVGISTSFSLTSAINEITQAGRTGTKTDQISAATVVLPNNVFGAYEALGPRLWDTKAGAEVPLYVVPNGEIKAAVKAVADQTLTGPGGSVPMRRFDLTLPNPSGQVNAVVVIDNHLRLVRFELPDIGLQVVREDLSSVAMRTQTARNPTDAEVMIPANGFQLAGTMTTPASVAGRLHYPAIVLVGGASPADRDEIVDGVPIFTNLARALSEAGHIVLRYDRRGSGQSGGRTDAVTLADYADDAIAAMKWLAKQDGVDSRHIVLVGYADGAAVSFTAAAHEKRIAGVATLNASGSVGADLVLARQQKLLDQMNLAPAERQARIEMQKKIQAAVISGKGWEGIPDAIRRQSDTPWFKSVLTYNPALVLPQVRQPLLIVHGDLDQSVPSSEGDLLVQIANTRKKAGPAAVVHIPDVNQTFSDPKTRAISEKLVSALVEWIHKL